MKCTRLRRFACFASFIPKKLCLESLGCAHILGVIVLLRHAQLPPCLYSQTHVALTGQEAVEKSF